MSPKNAVGLYKSSEGSKQYIWMSWRPTEFYFSAREGKQKLKYAIFGYFFDVIILAINYARNPSENRELVSFNIFKDLYRLKNDTRCLETLLTMQERICRLALSADD
jgi:hypothetical protein